MYVCMFGYVGVSVCLYPCVYGGVPTAAHAMMYVGHDLKDWVVSFHLVGQTPTIRLRGKHCDPFA